MCFYIKMLKWKHPSTCMVTGPSQCGKTELVRKIIASKIYEHEIKNILWCYSVWQPWFLEHKEIKFINGLPTEEDASDLIIIDDLMNDLTLNVAHMFTVGSHHKHYSIILITQNLFPRVKAMRDISLNTHYLIMFRNNRDLSQANCFARQAFPGNSIYFMDAYKKATVEPYTYLLVDIHPRTPEDQRLRQSIFPEKDFLNWVYLPMKHA